MKILIVEDDKISRKVLEEFLKPLGRCEIAVDGLRAVEVFKLSLDSGNPFQLICLDIMMPEMDGHTVLKVIREHEKKHGIDSDRAAKVVMTTALEDPQNVVGAFDKGCSSYVTKPIDKQKLSVELQKLGIDGLSGE